MQYIDETKIESVANKYTFVWRGSVEKYDAGLKSKTEALLYQIEQKYAIESDENPRRRNSPRKRSPKKWTG